MTEDVAPSWDATHIERVFRDVFGQAVASLVRTFGDIALAEDAVQDAFVVASERWATEGIPTNPAGWIVTTARNRAVDVVRRSARGRDLHEQSVAVMSPDKPGEWSPIADDQLRLIFTCCHPALKDEHKVALTLRLLGGLSVSELARSFLVTEAAIAKRLVRAKYKIRAAQIPYRVPNDRDLSARLRPVLTVIYLIYNTGADDDERSALRSEGVRLARLLTELMPDEPEAAGLLALVLFNESRMGARRVDGEAVLLSDQDRTKWDVQLIEEGHAVLDACAGRNQPGPFQVQAAIQSEHCKASTFGQTAWHRIVDLYARLYSMTPTPVVALNRAIAMSEVDGPEAALEVIDQIGPGLDNYHLMHATRATLLRRLDRHTESADAFKRAARLAVSPSDQMFLERQIAEVAGDIDVS